MQSDNKSDGNKKPRMKKVTLGILGFIGATILGVIISTPVNDFITAWKEKPYSSKYIAIVTSDADPSFTIPMEFRKGFGHHNPYSTKNNQEIRFETRDDQLSEVQTKVISDNLINDPNCIMIIGNSNSTLSDVTLNAILNSNQIKPVFILPIASADNLIKKSGSEGYKSILRMIPDNKNQAKVITRFILNKISNTAKVIILVDEENQTYSNNLAKNVASGIIAGEGNIILSKYYGNNNRFVPEYEVLRKNKIKFDVIVYVGISSNGILLIEEMKTLKIKTPIIFTDGCTVEELMEKAKQAFGNNAYFLSAVSKLENNIKPTYEPIGKDAFNLAMSILKAVEGQGPITRESVSRYVAENKTNIDFSGEAGYYHFSEDGNNDKMDFIVYTYRNNTLNDVKGIK